PEELDQRGDTFFHRDLGHVCSGLDSQNRYVLLDEILQQVTIVAGYLDHETPLAKSKAVRHLITVSLAVVEPGIRIGRKICVIAKNILRALVLLQLHQEALAANVDVQRIIHFTAVQIRERWVSFAKRRQPKINEGRLQVCAAKAARLGRDFRLWRI